MIKVGILLEDGLIIKFQGFQFYLEQQEMDLQ
jgi:hypothetical protein